ncbi:CvpA family protein [Aquabacterium sp.]|uniref:CvpA family protein n=1 Tax=Aquabacterium sp. TaxID=1872578 RepID=UPI0024882E9B|nr:CvpA family protein [Aquabacterium sp.]MDI1260165.1 CvpA family protein [Aquabacterium sp.]
MGGAWTLVDVVLALGLALSVIVGAWRGLVTEVLALLGWAVAYFAAQWYGPEGAKFMPVGEPGSRLNLISGMLVVFVLAWLGWALISWAVAQMIKASVLSGPDRVLGAGFGLLRGVLVALIVCTVVSMTPVTHWVPWQASRGVAGLQILLTGLRPVLPEQVVKFLPGQP